MPWTFRVVFSTKSADSARGLRILNVYQHTVFDNGMAASDYRLILIFQLSKRSKELRWVGGSQTKAVEPTKNTKTEKTNVER